ncbi:hypothetical protein Tco_1373631 [Tanacetum coccineum]
MMVQALEDMGEDSAAPTDSHSTPIITQTSSSKPQKKQSRRKQRKDSGPTEPIPDEATNEEHVSTHSYDPSQSGEDRLQLTELMSLCTSLQEKILDLEKAKTAQAKEIASLKKRVKQLEKRKKSRTSGLKRLRKVGSASKVESSNDVSFGAQEDASKQERKIADLDDDDDKVTLIDETQERNDEEMFDDLQGEEVVAEKEVAEKEVSAADPVTTAGEVVTTTNTPTTTINELTPAQTLIEIKAAKHKAVTTTATTTTTTRSKARGAVVQEPSEFKTTSSPSQASQLPQAKDKGKAIMVEPKKSLKKKDQIALDEEVARNIEAQLQAELEEEERLARQKEEEATIALNESWDNTHAMIKADRLLVERLQTREQEELTDEEKARLFVDLLEKRKKHFTALRAKEKRNKPPTKAQKKSTMSTYLKHMVLKEQEKAKKQKGDDDQEEEEIKKHMEIVQDDEVVIDAISLATKPPMIIKYKIDKEGKSR